MTERIKSKQPEPPPRHQDPARKPQQPGTSPFDQVLRQSTVVRPKAMQVQQQASWSSETQEVHKERKHVRERSKGRVRQETELDRHGKKKSAVEGERSEGPQHRVVVKTSQREGKGQGQQGQSQGQGSGQGGPGGRGKAEAVLREQVRTKTAFEASVKSAFVDQLATQAQKKVPKHLTSEQMQRLVNQMLQSIRVGKSELGGDELQLGFQAHIFQGLRLRLQEKDGKVTVSFLSQNKEIRDLFERESGRIQRALEERGVSVDVVQVLS